jgi:ribosomal protein S12 methylthiotransferase accessory factor
MLPEIQDSALKAFRAGAHRLVPPEVTLARLRPLLAEMEITRVANVTGLDRIGIPVVMVYRPNSRGLVCAQGKGHTLAAAKASGIMEAIETYHAERVALPLEFGSYADLRHTHRLADPMQLDHPIETLFRPDLPISWIEGFDLVQQESVWVPFELVTRDYTVPAPAGRGCFVSSCNGLASGNHVLEAISHGICELVERDAATLMGLSGPELHRRSLVRLDTVDDPACRETLNKYAAADFEVGVWEITSDVGIPAFVCRIRERTGEAPRRIAAGFGCHPSRGVAMLRSLNEAAQNRLIAISGSLDDSPESGDEGPRRSGQIKQSIAAELPDPWFNIQHPQRDFAEGAKWESDNFEEDVRWELERLCAAGLKQVIVVNLSKPEFGVPVVRVIIPGLECAILYAGRYALGQRAQNHVARLPS